MQHKCPAKRRKRAQHQRIIRIHFARQKDRCGRAQRRQHDGRSCKTAELLLQCSQQHAKRRRKRPTDVLPPGKRNAFQQIRHCSGRSVIQKNIVVDIGRVRIAQRAVKLKIGDPRQDGQRHAGKEIPGALQSAAHILFTEHHNSLRRTQADEQP